LGETPDHKNIDKSHILTKINKMETGIDVCVKNNFLKFGKKRLGLLVHSASVDSSLSYTHDLFLQNCNVTALFSPEHGLYGTQEYMEEVETFKYQDISVYSLYGKHLEPTKEMLDEIDTMVIDLQDIGTRYYTYIWTIVLTLQACARYNKKVILLDRPNPINGRIVEGPILSSNYRSFVGLYPIPVRHGMTIGELANMFNTHFNIGADLEIIKMRNWQRDMWFDDTKLPWIPPSPNIPTLESATVYPGMCLLEGTNISEARGTTKPFEFFGAPWIEAQDVCEKLNKMGLQGVFFRPVQFVPAKDKYKGKICKGAQIHVTQRDNFSPFITGITVIKVIRDMYSQCFKWRKPPYEYENKRLPFDLLVGNSYIRREIEKNIEINKLPDIWKEELKSFLSLRSKYLFYI
jgi:uncharacterized protein YbbC (DUF1343 family)